MYMNNEFRRSFTHVPHWREVSKTILNSSSLNSYTNAANIFRKTSPN